MHVTIVGGYPRELTNDPLTGTVVDVRDGGDCVTVELDDGRQLMLSGVTDTCHRFSVCDVVDITPTTQWNVRVTR